jgi:hypoxanthine phosphoribosyltransferase
MSVAGSAGRVLLSREDLARTALRIGESISEDHPEGIVLVGILKGSVCLVADVARHISVPCAVDFLGLSAYSAGGSRVKVSKDLDEDVTGRDTVIAVDIVDSGLTVSYVRRLLKERGARSIDVCALLDRRRRRLLPVEVRYVGCEIGDEYVVGYGLDFEERFRNLPMLVATDPDELRIESETSPVASVTALFGR